MGRYEEIVKMLELENQEWEKDILKKWIKQEGEEVVFEECVKIANGEIEEDYEDY